MARLGLLRHVEVISTVSGGSIVGALYYLHVKRLLEAKGDEEVTDQDYIAIITRIEEDFLRGVQQNLRMRTFINPLKALRMALPNYSRSDRIGELYDEYFYRPVLDPNRTTLIAMRELKIQPKGAKPDFNPQDDNDGRRAKAPILLLNATSLNTGHNWRFEAVGWESRPGKGSSPKRSTRTSGCAVLPPTTRSPKSSKTSNSASRSPPPPVFRGFSAAGDQRSLST